MSRRASRGAAMTYGRRHQLRQVHTERNDWGSIFGKEETDPIFGSSTSSEHGSSSKCLDASTDVSAGSPSIVNTKRIGRISKTNQQNKENVTKKYDVRKPRNKKATDLYTISYDGLSNTSSETETVGRRNEPLRMRNVNTATQPKSQKAKKVLNKRKTRKKPKVVQDKSGQQYMDNNVQKTRAAHVEHFSEFEDFSLCIELEDKVDTKMAVSVPSHLTPSSSSNYSGVSSTGQHPHSTPTLHTSTPQSLHRQPRHLFHRLTMSNLKKLAASGEPFVRSGLGTVDSPFDCVEASPAFSHISRRGSLESDLGELYLNASQNESGVSISAAAPFLVTMRRKKILSQTNKFNMSRIMSPGFPSPASHRPSQPYHIGDDSSKHFVGEQSMEALPEHGLDLLLEQSVAVLTENVCNEQKTDIVAPMAISVQNLSSLYISGVNNESESSGQSKSAPEQCGLLEGGEEIEIFYSTEDYDGVRCKQDPVSEVTPEKNSFHCNNLSDNVHALSGSKGHVDREGGAHSDDDAAFTQSDSEVHPQNESEEYSAEDERLTASHTQSDCKKQKIHPNIYDCEIVLDRLTDSFISSCTHLTQLLSSSEYDASQSLFNDTNAHSHSINKSTDYDTAEDYVYESEALRAMSKNMVYRTSSAEDMSIRQDEMPSPTNHSFQDKRLSVLSCVHELDLEESFRSLQILTPIKNPSSGLVITPLAKVLLQCGQEDYISFTDCIPPVMMKKCVKIGEGVYGEVFRSENRKASVALKIIPIEGNFTVNDEPQKTFSEILSEIVISQTLSNLSEGDDNSTTNYVQVRSCSLVQGNYPDVLIKCWDSYHAAKVSDNDRPDMFPEDQLFIIFEFANSGCDLDGFEFHTLEEAKSVLVQVAISLAVGEASFGFEHRDLHWGNVLVRRSSGTPILEFTLNGKAMCISTGGVKAAVIDFTLSRIQKDGCTVWTDLSKDPALFEGTGDYQFDVYRLMKEENRDNWEPFHPFTNVLWLHYLADKLLKGKTYPKSSSKVHQALARQFRTLIRETLDYRSAVHLVTQCSFFTNEYL